MRNRERRPNSSTKVRAKRARCARKGPGSPLFNQPDYASPWKQKPQSSIRELKDMTEEERREIRERLGLS